MRPQLHTHSCLVLQNLAHSVPGKCVYAAAYTFNLQGQTQDKMSLQGGNCEQMREYVYVRFRIYAFTSGRVQQLLPILTPEAALLLDIGSTLQEDETLEALTILTVSMSPIHMGSKSIREDNLKL